MITKKELESMVVNGATLRQIADHLGYKSMNSARNLLDKHGISDRSRSSKHWNELDDKFLTENYSKGVAYCCEELGRPKDSIYQRARRLGIKYPTNMDIYSKEFLEQEYVSNKKSILKIAEECDSEYWTVYGALIRHGIPIDKSGRYFGKDHHNWVGHGEISQTHWGEIKNSASHGRSRVIPFDITIQQGWDIYIHQNSKCNLSGLDINFSKTGGKRYASTTASLDRIDSSLGYSVSNCQWLHKTVNAMKMALQQDEFIRFCVLIANNEENKCFARM